jgi:hypothetical protein
MHKKIIIRIPIMSDFKEYADLILNELKRQDLDHRDTMDELNKIKDAQSEHEKTLLRNTLSLEDHMRRTEILEDLHGINASRIDEHDVKLEELEKPHLAVSVLKKWIIGLGAVASAAVAISKFFGLF